MLMLALASVSLGPRLEPSPEVARLAANPLPLDVNVKFPKLPQRQRVLRTAKLCRKASIQRYRSHYPYYTRMMLYVHKRYI